MGKLKSSHKLVFYTGGSCCLECFNRVTFYYGLFQSDSCLECFNRVTFY